MRPATSRAAGSLATTILDAASRFTFEIDDRDVVLDD